MKVTWSISDSIGRKTEGGTGWSELRQRVQNLPDEPERYDCGKTGVNGNHWFVAFFPKRKLVTYTGRIAGSDDNLVVEVSYAS